MKKVICFVMAFLMLLLPLTSFADAGAEDMQSVLLIVKGKADIPQELSEFSSHIAQSGDKKSYSFEWTDKDYKKSISINCDDEGRINSYYNYSFEMSGKKLSKISKNEIISYAQAFLKKIVPEAFENENDCLIYDEKSYNARGNLRYTLTFNRVRNSIPVKDNNANVTLCIVDDKIYVRDMSVNFNYDAQFDDGNEIENFEEKYTEAFPLELVYCDEYNYNAKKGESRAYPVLVYRIKDNNIGYISITTGEVIEEDTYNSVFREESAVMDSMAMGGSNSSLKQSLTEQEIKQISTVEGLLSVDDVQKILKSLPYINFAGTLKLSNSYLTENDRGEYFYRLHYSTTDEKSYRYLSAVINAHNGKVISISNNMPYDGASDIKLTDREKAQVEQKMQTFLNKVSADEIKNSVKKSSDSYSNIVSDTYIRIVNGIEYVDNTVNISFDAKNNVVRSFSADFRDGDFKNPDAAITPDAAYEKILGFSPVTKMYISSGGKYVKAATLEKRYIKLDALTGEMKEVYDDTQKSYEYSDIDGHWAQEAATKLAEIQIGIEGGALNPDKGITQEEFFRLVCSGMINKYYANYTQEELYDVLITDKIISEGEKSPDALITREQAFIYIIRLAGLERVAKLENIYKIEYADSHLLTNGKIGYSAILSGLNVIEGDGGSLRPKDNLTRAEAIVILYRYLLTL